MADTDGFCLVSGKKARKVRQQVTHSVSNRQERADLQHFDLHAFRKRLDGCIQEVVTSQFFLRSYENTIAAISILVQKMTASGDKEQSDDIHHNCSTTTPDTCPAASVTSKAPDMPTNPQISQSTNPPVSQSTDPVPPYSNPPVPHSINPSIPQSCNHNLLQMTCPLPSHSINLRLPHSTNLPLLQTVNSSLQQFTNSSLPQSTNHLPQSTNPLPQSTNPLPQATNPLPQSNNPLPQSTNPLPQSSNPHVPETATDSLDQPISSSLESLSLTKDDSDDIHLLSYGIGNFTTCLIARYQLAYLLAVRVKLGNKCMQCCIYDPVFSSQEKLILESYNCHVISDNEEGMRKCTGLTVAFLPHCGKALYNNLLWRNLATEQGQGLSRLVLIGNSFSDILERTPKRALTKTGNYILKLSPFLTEVHLVNTFTPKDVFNDLSIHYMSRPQLMAALQNIGEDLEKPNYIDDDAEFIRK